jgi:glycosyltransferase involved in cell wall biosynthesis
VKKVCIVSLRCAPGLQKEIASLCAGFEKRGWASTQLLAADYETLCEPSTNAHFQHLSRGHAGMMNDVARELWSRNLTRKLETLTPDFVLFYNLSPLNLLLMRQRTPGKPRFGVVLHDPAKAAKFRHGVSFAITYSFVEWLQAHLVKACEHVITLSDYGTTLAKTCYPGCGPKIVEGRILLADRVPATQARRTVVSIIGRINPATGHDDFFQLANELRHHLENVSFEIVTSSPAATAQSFERSARESGVTIRHKQVLTEGDIDDAIRRSLCVFRLDTELTQSGVIPVCYRLGTPVIVRDIPGLSQHVTEGQTGFRMRPTTSIAEIASWIVKLQSDGPRYEQNCRAAFAALWSVSAFDQYYGKLLESLEAL